MLTFRTYWVIIGVAIASALIPAAVAARIDLRTGRLPNALVLAAFLPSAAVALYSAVAGQLGTAGQILVGAVAFGAPLLVIHIVNPAAMGFGDVKLALALGATVGMVDARLAIVALFVACAIGFGCALTLSRRSFAFGPALVAGVFVTLALLAMRPEVVQW